MAGHSKWNNIKQRKGAQDKKKGKIFMRHAKNIYTAAKTGGSEMEMNASLRTAVDKAKSDNMPNDNIQRAIDKATGNIEGSNFEEVVYEGYGPGGTAVIVNALTDNKNRTAPEVRHAFRKHGGNLGENGSVSFMFDRLGYVVIENADHSIDEDDLTLEALEAGADDIANEEDAFVLYTAPEAFQDVYDHLNESGYTIAEGEVTMFPKNYNQLAEDDEEKMQKLIDTLEDNEDVQDIHHNLATSE